jgi:hypothetical protein
MLPSLFSVVLFFPLSTLRGAYHTAFGRFFYFKMEIIDNGGYNGKATGINTKLNTIVKLIKIKEHLSDNRITKNLNQCLYITS